MYVKRELAKVLYYDMFDKGRVVIKQGEYIQTTNYAHGDHCSIHRAKNFTLNIQWLTVDVY